MSFLDSNNKQTKLIGFIKQNNFNVFFKRAKKLPSSRLKIQSDNKLWLQRNNKFRNNQKTQ